MRGTPHQPAPTTPVHRRQVPEGQADKVQPATDEAGGETDEDQRTSAARNLERRLLLILILLCFRRQ